MTMNAATQVSERRAMRRFPMHLPALIRSADRFQEFITETRNISARGVFFYIDGQIAPQTRIEVTLTLPSQVTVSDSVRVRFTGRVIRVESGWGARIGIAAAIEEYEFLRTPELHTLKSDSQITA
jgi:PilZ domain